MADELEQLTDVVLAASRALIAVASRSIAAIDGSVTLPQFRALVVLDQNGGSCRVGDLASELRIHSSTATRLCDRLVHRGLVERSVDEANRREVTITLTDEGTSLFEQVTKVRRAEIGAILARIPPARRRTIVRALNDFRDAAGPDLAPPTVPW